MFENNNQKFYSFGRKFLKKLRPKFSIHYVVYTILLSFVVFSVVGIVTATTPNPGHPWAELGDGVFAVTNNQTGVRTYTFPDANATILTTNALVTVAQGGIGIGTLASNGILYGNGTGAVQALAVNAGATQCLTQASSGTPAWGSCGGASGLTIGTTTITSGSTGNILYNNAGVIGEMTTTGTGTVLALATSPVFVTPTLGAASATSLSSSGAIAANGGITFNDSTDTLGAFTAGGTIAMGAQSLTGSTGIIDYTGFDLDASGNLDALGTITSGSGNVALTDSIGNILHDAIVDCADGEILKWATGGGRWGCAADATGGGGLAVGGAIASGSTNRVLYEGSSNLLSESANFTYDGITLGVSNSSTTASNKVLNISQTGGTTGTDYAGYFSNTGSATINVGLYTTASGGTTNIGLNVDAGQTLLGGTTLTSGTLAKLNIVSTMTGTGSTTAIAGIHGDYTFNNGGTASYVQVGNRFVFNNAPTTNSNTMVGEVIRTIDNTTLANLVRGVEIVSNAGSNTAGTNTGLRSTGATFGVQAITNGSAGGVALPAGLYAENTGTTQGDVARFYTGTMTSAPSMLQVYHDTSTFTGDALLMDMAVGSGTFSGNFLELKNASVLKFKVTSAGVVSMGLSGTASTNAVCSSLANATTPTAGTAYEIRDCNAAPAADYAEMYPVESGIEFGDIVMTGIEMVNTYDNTDGNIDWTKVKGKVTRLIKSNKNYQSNVIGIVVDNYGDFTSAGHNIKDSDNPMPVALNGRVPVKVSSVSESIAPGDYITTSYEPGKATKATKAGQVIGKALEAWTPNTGKATVMVYVEQGFYNGQSISEFVGLSVENQMFARQVLQKFLGSPQNINAPSSELLLERIAVGVELITPKIVADKIEAGTISAGGGEDINLIVGDDGKFTIGEQTDAPAITFDSLGNATFTGTLTAREIKIDNLAGIQAITEQINSLAEGQQAFTLTAQAMNALTQALSITQADVLKLQTDLDTINASIAGLMTTGVDIDTRLKVIENFLIKDADGNINGFVMNMLTVTGDSSFTGKAQFDGLSFFSNTTSFTGGVTLAGQTEFVLPPLYNRDSAGYALVKQGDIRAKILFSQPYIATPVVNTSITFETEDNINDTEANTLFGNDVRFIITNKDQTGFTILLNKNAPRDIRFSWNALAVRDPSVFESVFEGLIIDPTPIPLPTDEFPTPSGETICTEPQVLDIGTNTCTDPTPDSGPELIPDETTCTDPQVLDVSTNSCVDPTPAPDPTRADSTQES